MSEMADRLTDAISNAYSDRPVALAGIVLMAIREPTEAMIVAGLQSEKGMTSPATLKRIWQAMVDAERK